MILLPEHLKNPRLLKEYIIKNGTDPLVQTEQVAPLIFKTPRKLKKYIEKYTKEDLKLLKKVLKNNGIIYNLLCVLRANSIKDYRHYKDITLAYCIDDLSETAIKLKKENSRLLAKWEKNKIKVVGLKVKDEKCLTLYILDIPKKLADCTKEMGNYYTADKLYSIYGVKQIDIYSTTPIDRYSNTSARNLCYTNLCDILSNIMKRNPVRINNIEQFMSNLLKLPPYKINKLAKILGRDYDHL